jgi:hypothetical protein
MASAVLDRSGTTFRMPKKKSSSGKHTTPRVNVGVPEDWHAVLRRIAAKHRQPLIYTLISLAKAEAESLGFTDLPPTPWDESEDE